MKKVLKQWASLLLLTVMVVANVLATGRIEKIQAATSVSGVSKVSNMSSDFMRGVDVSAVAALEKSGVSYKYLDGTSGDVFDIFAGAGVNYVRIRMTHLLHIKDMVVETVTFIMRRFLVNVRLMQE